ncbi:MAG: carbohydrate ABC transporter permease [Lachnospiraceae bacterium]|mgnify:FL=1|nr:carbohydrate ABC transporter permease [Lachnospiraceae bacterium]
MAKEKKVRERVNWRRELRLAPGYLILSLWVLFTFILLGWVIGASFSTSKEIFSGTVFQFESGFHLENYAKAWNASNVSVFFMNSLFYAAISCAFLVLICAPAAYVLSRFTFVGNKLVQNGFVAAMGVPATMIVLPLFGLVAGWNILNVSLANRAVLIFLYVGINVPYTTIFLLTFFSNLSRSFEEAAAIDGCPPMKTFWKIMLPMAQPGIITVTIFNFINVWNEYFMSLIFANSDKVKSVAIGLYGMINSMRYTGDYAGMFAAVVIVFLPTFLLYVFLSEKIIAGVTGGGVKG